MDPNNNNNSVPSDPSVDPGTNQISENPRESAAKKGRGGKRPGAGAPKGNMNALKHGLYSKQFAQVGALIAESDDARETLLQIAEPWGDKKLKADQVASDIVKQVITRGLQRGAQRLGDRPDRLIVLPPVDDRDSIKETSRRNLSKLSDAHHAASEIINDSMQINQKSDTTPDNNQILDTKSD